MLHRLSKRVTHLLAGLPRAYWYLWGGTLLNRLGMFVLPFLTIYLTTVRKVPISQAAFVASLVGIGSFCASLSGGFLADRIGRRFTMILGLVCAAAITLVLGFVQLLVGIAILAIFLGFWTDLYRPASAAAIADMIQPMDRIRAFGLLYWAINVGAAVAPIIAGIIAGTSYLILFLADALTTFAFSIFIWSGVPETRPDQEIHTSRMLVFSGIRIALKDTLLLSYTLLAFLFACIFFQCYATLPIDMYAHGMSTAEYGIAIAMNGLLIVGVSVPVSHILPRFPRHFALAGSALLMGTGFGLVGFVHTLPFYALTVIIWTMGELIAAPVGSTLIADLSPVHLRGLYSGVFGTAWGLAAFVGPALGGLVLEHFGNLSLWSGCFTLGLIVALGQLLLGRKLRKNTPGGSKVENEADEHGLSLLIQ
ncbi:MAG: MFS transporter [Ktedonobacteraceae bacterium]